MPLDVQTRLLRVLADGQFYRVGGHQPVQVDVRIIAATHQNLEKRVADGEFREDLFHRLNVIRIHIPALKERREDIPQLAQHFLLRAAKELNVEAKSLHPDTQAYISRLPWPGNVRQLENVCRWLTVMASGQEVLVSDLPTELLTPITSTAEPGQPALSGGWQQQLQDWVAAKLALGRPTSWPMPCPVRADHAGNRAGPYPWSQTGSGPPARLGAQHPHPQAEGTRPLLSPWEKRFPSRLGKSPANKTPFDFKRGIFEILPRMAGFHTDSKKAPS